MITRLLESNEVVRNTVKRIQFVKQEGHSLFFKTSFQLEYRTTHDLLKGADSIKKMEKNYSKEGIIRIDIISDKIIRIRYNEGDTIKENNTPMVVGTFEGPLKADLTKSKGIFIVTTNKLKIEISTKIFSIKIFNLENNKICGISGQEKNNFRNWDSYSTGICYSKIDDSPIGTECFDLDPHEAIYGFGERFTRLNKIGQTIDLIMDDAYGTISSRSYKNIPFFLSTKGYGVFINQSSLMTCWVGSKSVVNTQVAVEDNFLDYYVITGNIKEILSQYTDITGKGVVPPKWSFGYWQSKISYKSAEEVLEIANKLRETEVPCDVIHLDTHWFKEDWYCDLEFDKERFPDPEKFLEDLKQLGFKVSLWQLPYIPEGCKLFEELKAVEGFVKTKDDNIYDMEHCLTPGFQGIVGCIDFTNPKAIEIYKKWIRRLLKLGVKAIKTDFGENTPLEGVYHDGTPGHQMRNLGPLLYNKVVAEVTKEVTGDICAWSRSAWAGNQRYPVHWGGDSSVNWENMTPQLEGSLSFGLSGFQFWSQDIGGFIGTTRGDILIRWMQVGLFHSHSRIHGWGKRELYKFPSEVMRICRNYIQLRYRLLPYIYGSAFDCVEKSLPMTRALVVEYQNDPNTWNIGNEFMFGDSLLVAPITDTTNKREIYLPKGVWTNWWTGERLRGEKWIHVEVDIETLPFYIREGGIIPMGPVMNYVDEIKTEEIELRIAKFEGDGKTTFVVPVNEERVLIEYTASNGKHTVNIAKTNITFKIEAVGSDEKTIEVIIK